MRNGIREDYRDKAFRLIIVRVNETMEREVNYSIEPYVGSRELKFGVFNFGIYAGFDSFVSYGQMAVSDQGYLSIAGASEDYWSE